jgi:hypothetical protein
VYAKTLSIYNFRCFGRAILELRHPDKADSKLLEMPNVNLILGDNGGGKSSVLRAIAIAALAPALIDSGFVAHRMVRRPDAKETLLKLTCDIDPLDLVNKSSVYSSVELLARIERRGSGSLDRLHLDKTPESPIERLIYDDKSHTFFVVGYGATRRTETGDFVDSSARRSRGLRYLRVAGLFEDQVTLRPLQAWLPKISNKKRKQEAIEKINSLLPLGVTFDGSYDKVEQQFIFKFEGVRTPFTSLSDGYKAFIGWCGDLIGHLCDVTPRNLSIDRISGIVLIDEIDLHLHPSWQRTVLPTLAKSFPRLQFVVTSHSPLVASAARKENIFVTDIASDSTATIKQIEEKAFGRGADQLLLSSYFGLETSRSPLFESKSKTLFAQAAKGDVKSAIAYLNQLAAPTTDRTELRPEVKLALEANIGKGGKPNKNAKEGAKTRSTRKRVIKK